MAHPLALPKAELPEIPALPVIPLRAVVPWALFAGLLALVALYFLGTEQGAVSLFPGTVLHELVHDGRHLFGAPCH